MTTGLPETPPLEVKGWAAAQLGLSPAAAAEEVRAVALQTLADEDFVPLASWQQALGVLVPWWPGATTAPSLDYPALLEREEELRSDVEDFAAAFFDTDLVERRQRWQQLVEHGAWSPPLMARLRALEPGLAVNPSRLNGTDPRLARLARHACALFILRPAERAVSRRALVSSLEGEMALWETAAQRLRRETKEVAALEPELIDRLACWSRRQKGLARKRSRPRAVAQPAAAEGKTPAWVGWVLFFLLMGVLKALFGPSSQTTSPSPPRVNIPTLTAPTVPPDADFDKLKERLKALEELQKQGRQPPVRFPDLSKPRPTTPDGQAKPEQPLLPPAKDRAADPFVPRQPEKTPP